MKRRVTALLLAVLLLALPGIRCFAAGEDYEPYEDGEFPVWLHDLRRFEVLFIGALPVTMLVSVLSYNIYRSVEQYLENQSGFSLLGAFDTASLESEDKRTIFTIGLSLSAAISIADYILGRVERR